MIKEIFSYYNSKHCFHYHSESEIPNQYILNKNIILLLFKQILFISDFHFSIKLLEQSVSQQQRLSQTSGVMSQEHEEISLESEIKLLVFLSKIYFIKII